MIIFILSFADFLPLLLFASWWLLVYDGLFKSAEHVLHMKPHSSRHLPR